MIIVLKYVNALLEEIRQEKQTNLLFGGYYFWWARNTYVNPARSNAHGSLYGSRFKSRLVKTLFRKI